MILKENLIYPCDLEPHVFVNFGFFDIGKLDYDIEDLKNCPIHGFNCGFNGRKEVKK